MGKGANKQLLSNSGVAQSNSGQLSTAGSGINSFLTPQLESEATNPQGYTPQQLAYMNTASQQSQGGGVAATTGQANLTAARTRNAGGFQGAVGDANRTAQRNLSQTAVGIQSKQADLQQQQRQEALKSLQQLYGVDEGTALGYLNASSGALEGEDKATGTNAPFMNYLYNAQKSAGSAAAAGA
jgi:hypothetical protein